MTYTIDHQAPRDRKVTLKRNGDPLVEATWSPFGAAWLIELMDGTGFMFKVSELDNTADPADRDVPEPIERLLQLLGDGLVSERCNIANGTSLLQT